MFKVSYHAPQFSVSHQEYVNHGAITRPKVFKTKIDRLFLKLKGFRTGEFVQTKQFASAKRHRGSIFLQNLGPSAKNGHSLGRFGEETDSERVKIHQISKKETEASQSSFEPLKVLYTNNGDKPLSNYSADFVNGTTDARRSPIKPEQVSWTDRPKFEANSQYKVSSSTTSTTDCSLQCNVATLAINLLVKVQGS